LLSIKKRKQDFINKFNFNLIKMTVSQLMSELRHLDQDAEVIIDISSVENTDGKITVDYASPGDDGEVLINAKDA